MSPHISVIIPTYNRWPMLGEAIESVMAQSYRDFEVIVVDDGSTDGTARQLVRFGPQIRIVSQPNRGVSAARNLGVGQARGRYLAFLDSDDLWLVRKLERQIEFMQRNPTVQICQTDEIWIRNGVRVNPKAKHRKPSGDIFLPSLELCLVSPSAVMLSRDLFERVGGFDEAFPVCEDYDLWLRIAVDLDVALLDAPLVVKRGGHADQLSRAMWGMDRYRVYAMQKLLRGRLDAGRRAATIEMLRRKINVLAGGAQKRGKVSEAALYDDILAEFTQETHARARDSRICGDEGLSPADGGTVA